MQPNRSSALTLLSIHNNRWITCFKTEMNFIIHCYMGYLIIITFIVWLQITNTILWMHTEYLPLSPNVVTTHSLSTVAIMQKQSEDTYIHIGLSFEYAPYTIKSHSAFGMLMNWICHSVRFSPIDFAIILKDINTCTHTYRTAHSHTHTRKLCKFWCIATHWKSLFHF